MMSGGKQCRFAHSYTFVLFVHLFFCLLAANPIYFLITKLLVCCRFAHSSPGCTLRRSSATSTSRCACVMTGAPPLSGADDVALAPQSRMAVASVAAEAEKGGSLRSTATRECDCIVIAIGACIHGSPVRAEGRAQQRDAERDAQGRAESVGKQDEGRPRKSRTEVDSERSHHRTASAAAPRCESRPTLPALLESRAPARRAPEARCPA